MPEITSYEPGTFCWCELSTSDSNAAKSFYTQLFGWGVNEIPFDPSQPPYVLLQKNGKDAAALFQNPQVPPNWLQYVSVDDVDAAAEKAKSLGATIVGGPLDVMDVGRMAGLQDPEGAHFALWQRKRHIGAQIAGETGTVVWNELLTHNGDAARAFYSALFGWTPKVSPEYTEWHAGDKARGGMLEMNGPQFERMPAFWMPYFGVDDVDASAARARELGGQVHKEPADIPNVGRFAVLADPQGAAFSIFKYAGK
jgi:predicted enzyme related to lactoylglutathione lyase